MPLSERATIDRIEILENEVIQVRYARMILDNDGTVLNKIYRREVLVPGQDVNDKVLRLRRLCNFIWTPQVIADYKASVTGNAT